MKKPSLQSTEAAWRIWKTEVTTDHAPIQTVAEIANIIEGAFFPEEHDCRLMRDFTGTCFKCGKVEITSPHMP